MKIIEFYFWLAFLALVLLVKGLVYFPIVIPALILRPREAFDAIKEGWEEGRHMIWNEMNREDDDE